MNTCFECGGKLKVVAKPGRMAWDDDDELYEIPQELKISVCLECGQPFEDDFVKVKIQRAIEAQKKQAPSQRLKTLRWIDKQLNSMFKRTGMYASSNEAFWVQVLLLLEFREVILAKGDSAKPREIMDRLHTFQRKRWPEIGCCAFPSEEQADLESEFAPALREFCDVWINS